MPSIEHWYPEVWSISLLQVFCRWLCQLLAIIPGMANDKRETEAAAAEVKKVVSFCLCLSVVVKLQLVLLL